MFRKSRARAAIAGSLLLASCGSGTAGLLSGLGGGGGGGSQGAIVLGDLQVESGSGRAAESPASVSFRLTDSQSRPATVELLCLPPSGDPLPIVVVDGESLTALPSSPTGVTHVVHWDFASTLDDGAAYAAGYRVSARLVGAENWIESAEVAFGNDAPSATALVVPSTTATGTIEIHLDLVDSASDPVALVVEYQDSGLDGDWLSATLAGGDPTQLPTSPSGTSTVLFWSSAADEPQTSLDVRVRVRPSDAWSDGAHATSAAFPLDNNGAPVVADVEIAGSTRTPPASFTFSLDDAELDPADVEIYYVPAVGAPVLAMLDVTTDTTALATDGTTLTGAWDYASQLGNGPGYTNGVRLRVQAVDGGHYVDTPAFAVGNDAAEIVSTSVPSTPTQGLVPVAFRVEDTSSDSISVAVEYSIDGGTSWQPATLVGPAPANIAATPSGVDFTVFWDAPSDEPGSSETARLRFTAYDGTATSTPVTTSPFTVDNDSRPRAIVNGSAFFATSDQRRGIPLPLRVEDDEGDPVRVVVQWKTAFGTFPDLPELASELDALLDDPASRRALQIASEHEIEFGGRALVTSGATVRLPEIGTDACVLAGNGMEGAVLELVRASGAPSSAATSWTSNPLVAPVGVVACDDASSAYVLDSPSSGAWRLRRIHLASGTVLDTIAQGVTGTPSALAAGFDADELLVACDVSGAWRVERVDVATGTVTTLGTSGGSTLTGTVRGLAAAGHASAYASVASSLVLVDATAGTVSTIGSAWSAPQGLALDPRHDGRLLVAERDWTNPLTSGVEGRVASIDVRTLERRTLTSSGFALSRPVGIGVEPGTARLWVITDANTADATRELRVLDLGSGGGGVAAQISATLSSQTQAISAGLDGLVVATVASGDLLVSGGVVDARTIASVDVTSATATLESAFTSVVAGQRWRIRARAGETAFEPSLNERRFVWLSSDVPHAGEVMLRATPYDTRRGIADDTGVPRRVRATLDVSPSTVGSAATSGATGITSADLDGDGDFDLAVASTGSDQLTVFLRNAAGTFPTTPSQTLSGIAIVAPMTDPVAVRAVDVDSDGDLDLVTANRGSNNFSVCLQTTPGNFVTNLLSLGIGGSGPVDVAAGDLNGDGRIDLVTANGTGNNVTVHFQLLLGLYLTLPSLTLGGAGTTTTPSGVAVGDFDGDGDLDIASSNAGANTVSIFRQTAAGVISSTPWATLGNASVTSGPSAISAGDVDGDGRLDLAVANQTGSDVAIFLQSSTGGFATTPTWSLSSADGPVQPRHLRLADFNGDGALDVATVDADDELSVFVWDEELAAFADDAISIDGDALLSGPRQLAAADFDGDGRTDAAVTNATSGNVAVFLQRGAGAYSATEPELVLGDSTDTPGASGVALGDLDGDGDLDLAVASPTSHRVQTYEQLSPSNFASDPRFTLGSAATTAGVSAVASADLDGDGRMDLATANTSAGTIALFLQRSSGTFVATPDQTLGAGTLGGIAALVAADVDGDGRVDLVSANPTSGDLAFFLQSGAGTFSSTPTQRLGSSLTTAGVAHLAAADVDSDGDLDLVGANRTQQNLTVFRQTSAGVFASSPAYTLGSSLTTRQPIAVVMRDVDRDGRVDLVSANATGNDVTVFLRNPDGSFPSSPSATLSDAALTTPSTLAVCDVTGDGLLDLVVGNSGSDNLLVFRQLVPGTFARHQSLGTSAFTPQPTSLVAADLDGDGDADLVSAQAALHDVAVYFGSH